MAIRLRDKFMAPLPEGDEPDLLMVEYGEILVCGQFRIKDEYRFHRHFGTLPEGEEGEDPVIGLACAEYLRRKKE